ncbi:MAG: DUF438 domain-containing protein [Candidatus Zixiibacteriota bacterium]
MSELIDNVRKRKDLLKHMILQLHSGEAPEAVKGQLARLMGSVPYDIVVEVEQELISEGLPYEEVLRLCDIHTAALEGQISHEGAKEAPEGHPVHTFRQENKALQWELDALKKLFELLTSTPDDDAVQTMVGLARVRFQALTDVEKHYLRKENLLFPYMEQHGITGPPKVMWGKHDETRALLKAAVSSFEQASRVKKDEVMGLVDLLWKPAAKAIEDMIYKEEEILLPMCMDALSQQEWYQIYSQSLEFGFCLFDPTTEWKPDGVTEETGSVSDSGKTRLPSGSFTTEELTAILNTIPFDLTFVDADDTVRFFTQGSERIFARNRAILGRKVQLCHPPSSTHIVQQILDDFRSGKEDRAPFWIEMKGQFIHIEYLALRDKSGKYLGTLEVSQNLTEKRALTGEQRLLSYVKG